MPYYRQNGEIVNYKKCSFVKCGEIECPPNVVIERDVVSTSEVVVQPGSTVVVPIRVEKFKSVDSYARHMLWDLKISCRLASRLGVNTQRQPVRPCMFRTLSIYNNNTKPIIINNGQVIAEIDNRDQISLNSFFRMPKAKSKTRFSKNHQINRVHAVEIN